MEYYLCRAMEVARLTGEQLLRLQAHEKKPRIGKEWDSKTQTFKTIEEKIVRVLNPWEIQDCFDPCTLREHWAIPDNDSAMSQHNSRLRAELRKAKMGGGEEKNLVPLYDFQMCGNENVERVHRFDAEIKKVVISFRFQYGGPLKGKATEKLKKKLEKISEESD